MIDLNQIESLTQVYLCSYNTALKETKNPNLAVQVAMSIIMVVFTTEQNQRPKINPLQLLATALYQQAQKPEKAPEENGGEEE